MGILILIYLEEKAIYINLVKELLLLLENFKGKNHYTNICDIKD